MRSSRIAAWLLQSALMTASLASPVWSQDLKSFLELYGEASDQRRDVQRAKQIFHRVSVAADRSGSRYPQFHVVKEPIHPLARAFKDGGIVVNLRAIDLCRSVFGLRHGDDCLAFVLAHELSHLVNEGEGASFASVEAEVEDRADKQGLLTMTMAGFRPESLLESSKTLFREWLDRTPGSPDNADSRAEAFKSRLKDFSKFVPIFQSALILYHVGRYREAIQLFGEFRQEFPSREVFHNLGVSYMQQALGVLALCDGNQVVRFYLPVQADPWTLAERSRYRGPSQECWETSLFEQFANEAERYFREAIGRDPSYVLARAHLATLKVHRHQYTEAWSKANEALKLAPDDPYAINIEALSSFLLSKEIGGSDLAQNAFVKLKKLRRDSPGFLPAIFNLARLESLSGNPEAARSSWQAYLESAPPDEMARAAAEELNLDLPSTSKPIRPSRQPQIPLGIADKSTQAKLHQMVLIHESRPIEVRGSEEMRVIRIDRSVEVVEEFMGLPASTARLKGLPAIQGANLSFSLHLESKGVALKVVGGQILSRVFFRPLSESEGKTAASGSPGEKVTPSSPQPGTEFAYSGDNGPGFWGSLKPEWKECSSNNRQTPIDIADVTIEPNLAVPRLDLQPAPIRLLNRGFDIQQSYAEGAGGTIRLEGTDYHLRQFHFHTLSEHTFNGRHASMEMHVVSENPDSGKLVVIGVPYEIGQESAFLAQFSSHLPAKKGDRYDSPQRINVADELSTIGSFYTYEGSLTTPGCLPIVTWFVLKQPALMSERQFQSFRKIMGNNFRPLQERGNRIVRATPR